jgi:hypothetical protein
MHCSSSWYTNKNTRNRDLHEKLIVAWLVKKFPTFRVIQMFVTVFTTSECSQHPHLKFSLHFLSPPCFLFHVYVIFIDLVTLKIFCESTNYEASQYVISCSLVTSSFFGQNISLITALSILVELFYSWVKTQSLKPMQNNMSLCILISYPFSETVCNIAFCIMVTFLWWRFVIRLFNISLEDNLKLFTVTAYSLHLQLLPITGNHLLHPQPKDMPCCVDEGPM